MKKKTCVRLIFVCSDGLSSIDVNIFPHPSSSDIRLMMVSSDWQCT